VYCVIFLRPSSPSFDMRSRYGHTTVSSWMMIEALMYGMTPSAKIVTRDKLPPVNMFARPNIDPAN
jgi:hypothetical protein